LMLYGNSAIVRLTISCAKRAESRDIHHACKK
jgi:hypothetical protein